MTITTQVHRVDYVGGGTTATYVYPFKIFESGDLEVIQTVAATGVATTLALTTDYSVTGVGVDAGGTIVLIAGILATGQLLTIKRTVDIVQEAVYTDGDSFPAQAHEDALDYGCMIDQQLQEQADRSWHWPEGSTNSSLMPTNITGVPLYLTINAAGTAVVGTLTALTTTFDLNWIDVKSYGSGTLSNAALAAAIAANPSGGTLYFGGPCSITSAHDLTGFTIADGPYEIFTCSGAGAITFDPYQSIRYGEWLGDHTLTRVSTQPAQGTQTTIESLVSATSGTPPFQVALQSALMNGFWDTFFAMGFNLGNYSPFTGGTSNKPCLLMVFENDFYDTANHTMEWYIHYRSPDKTSVNFRPIYMSIKRDDNTSYAATINQDIGDATGSYRIFALGVEPVDPLFTVTSDAITCDVPTQVFKAFLINQTGAQSSLTMSDNLSGSYPDIYLKGGLGAYNYNISVNTLLTGFAITPSTAVNGSTYTTPIFTIDTYGVGVNMGTTNASSFNSTFGVGGLPAHANNAAARAGGLTTGAFYRTGADPDVVCVVHDAP